MNPQSPSSSSIISGKFVIGLLLFVLLFSGLLFFRVIAVTNQPVNPQSCAYKLRNCSCYKNKSNGLKGILNDSMGACVSLEGTDLSNFEGCLPLAGNVSCSIGDFPEGFSTVRDWVLEFGTGKMYVQVESMDPNVCDPGISVCLGNMTYQHCTV